MDFRSKAISLCFTLDLLFLFDDALDAILDFIWGGINPTGFITYNIFSLFRELTHIFNARKIKLNI